MAGQAMGVWKRIGANPTGADIIDATEEQRREWFTQAARLDAEARWLREMGLDRSDLYTSRVDSLETRARDEADRRKLRYEDFRGPLWKLIPACRATAKADVLRMFAAVPELIAFAKAFGLYRTGQLRMHDVDEAFDAAMAELEPSEIPTH